MRTRFCILALGIGVLLAPIVMSRAFAQAGESLLAPQKIDLAGFIRETGDLSKRVAASDAAGARDILASLPPAWWVRHGSDEFRMSTEWIAGPLRQGGSRPDDWAKARGVLVARLDAVHREALDMQANDEARGEGRAGTAPPEMAAARATLRDVLARSEFKQRAGSSWSNILRQRIQEWIQSFTQRLLINRRAATTFSRVLAWVVAIGALVALGVYLFRAGLPRRAFTPLAIEVPRASSAEWAARAYAALRAGDAREAMHCGYHAVLFRLEEQGVWRVDDARTPREYVRLLPAQDARRAAFLDLTRRFEQTWYGSRAADGQGLLTHLEAFGCSAPSKPTI